MRKMCVPSNTACRVWFSARADARSRPNGFSTTTARPSEAARSGPAPARRSRTGSAGSRGSAADDCARPRASCRPVEGGGVAVVAVDVAQQPQQALGRTRTGLQPPNFSRLSRARARRSFEAQPALATPTTGTSSRPCRTIACERREDLLVSQIAGGPEEHQRVRARPIGHGAPTLPIATDSIDARLMLRTSSLPAAGGCDGGAVDGQHDRA